MGLYKRNNSKFWWMKYTLNGKRISESTKTSNRKLAEKIYAKRQVECVEGMWFDTGTKRRTFKEMITKYETEYLCRKKYPARDKSILKNLENYFGGRTALRGIDNLIGGYESHRSPDAMPATVSKELALLRRMFNLAIKWRWVSENPVDLIEMPHVKNERIRFLSEDEYKRLFEALDNPEMPVWLKPIIITALNAGLREGNILRLRWSQVNLFSRLISIKGAEMKNRENLGLPLTQEAFQTFMRLHKVRRIGTDLVFHDEGKEIYPVKLQRAMRKVCKLAEIEDFRFHDLRHTFASYLRQKGVDLHTISKLLGHKDIRMTQRYSHLSVENLREAVSVLDRQDKAEGYIPVTVERSQAHDSL
jgi:integrase